MKLETLHKLSEQLGSSFYLFNGDLFIQNLSQFKNAFYKHYPNVELGYSYKTNYLPAACEIVRNEGHLPEVVSGMEYDLALKMGNKGDTIIFNGPLKEKADLLKAFNNNSIVHFDSYEEVKILKEFLQHNPNSQVRCALRCNFDIGEENRSRFGFDAENGEAQKVYKELFSLEGCLPIGVHCHFSTQHRSLGSFKIRTSKLVAFAKKVFDGKKLQYIDIGGGYFGELPKSIKPLFTVQPPTYEDYGTAIANIMNKNFPDKNVSLILEPGASVVANTMKFVCKVASVKVIDSKPVVTLTGGLHNVRPTGSSGDIPFSVVPLDALSQKKIENALIGGYTCMETDIICRNYTGNLAVGDFLLFEAMGAYNIVFKPPFIKESPPIVMADEDMVKQKLVKKRESVEDIFSSYIFS